MFAGIDGNGHALLLHYQRLGQWVIFSLILFSLESTARKMVIATYLRHKDPQTSVSNTDLRLNYKVWLFCNQI